MLRLPFLKARLANKIADFIRLDQFPWHQYKTAMGGGEYLLFSPPLKGWHCLTPV